MEKWGIFFQALMTSLSYFDIYWGIQRDAEEEWAKITGRSILRVLFQFFNFLNMNSISYKFDLDFDLYPAVDWVWLETIFHIFLREGEEIGIRKEGTDFEVEGEYLRCNMFSKNFRLKLLKYEKAWENRKFWRKKKLQTFLIFLQTFFKSSINL